MIPVLFASLVFGAVLVVVSFAESLKPLPLVRWSGRAIGAALVLVSTVLITLGGTSS